MKLTLTNYVCIYINIYHWWAYTIHSQLSVKGIKMSDFNIVLLFYILHVVYTVDKTCNVPFTSPHIHVCYPRPCWQCNLSPAIFTVETKNLNNVQFSYERKVRAYKWLRLSPTSMTKIENLQLSVSVMCALERGFGKLPVDLLWWWR